MTKGPLPIAGSYIMALASRVNLNSRFSTSNSGNSQEYNEVDDEVDANADVDVEIPSRERANEHRRMNTKSSSIIRATASDDDDERFMSGILPSSSTESTAIHDSSFSLMRSAIAPVLLGMIPATMSLAFGESRAWLEFCLFVLIAFWLYYVLKVPWDLYIESTTRRSGSLGVAERFYLVLVFLSPLIGGYSLHLIKSHFGTDGPILSQFSLPLFIMAAFLRPLIHFLSAIEQKAGDGNVRASSNTIHCREKPKIAEMQILTRQLQSRIKLLEQEIAMIKAEVDSPSIDTDIRQLTRSVKKYKQREAVLQDVMIDRVDHLETRLRNIEKKSSLLSTISSRLIKIAISALFFPISSTKRIAYWLLRALFSS